MSPQGIAELPLLVAEQTLEVTQVMSPEDLVHCDYPQQAQAAHKQKSNEPQDIALAPGRSQRAFKPIELTVTLFIIIYMYKTLKLASITHIEN